MNNTGNKKTSYLVCEECVDGICRLACSHQVKVKVSGKHSSNRNVSVTTRCQYKSGGPQVNKFEQISRNDHQIILACGVPVQ